MNYIKKNKFEQVVQSKEILGEEFVKAFSKVARVFNIFYIIIPDMQYFKEGMPPSCRIPLSNHNLVLYRI